MPIICAIAAHGQTQDQLIRPIAGVIHLSIHLSPFSAEDRKLFIYKPQMAAYEQNKLLQPQLGRSPA